MSITQNPRSRVIQMEQSPAIIMVATTGGETGARLSSSIWSALERHLRAILYPEIPPKRKIT